MKTYGIKELFLTLQGEGARAGSKAVFLRCTGCNAWTGHPEDRKRGRMSCSEWCDTDFVHGEKLIAAEILVRMDALWLAAPGEKRWVVITGGEPLLQLDRALVDALHAGGWMIAVETNGTLDPAGDAGTDNLLDVVDWLCVSPKIGGDLKRLRADELKVILPGGIDRTCWTDAALLDLAARGTWGALYVQPQDPVDPASIGRTYLHGGHPASASDYGAHVRRCVEFVQAHPTWRVSAQIHKFLSLR